MTVTTLEQERIDKLAEEYRAKGYAVHVHPTAAELPPFLRNYEIEILATSPSLNLAMQVKAPSRFDAEETKTLADVLHSRPDWKFIVSFVSPPLGPDVPAVEDLAAEEEVLRFLGNAEALSDQGQIEAAGLIAWSAVETILRRIARAAAPDLERESSSRVLKSLYSRGHLDPQIYEKLLGLLDYRNAVAHGFQPRTAAPSIPDIIEDIRRLDDAA